MKENGIDFNDPNGSTIVHGDYSGEIVADEWTVVSEGVRFRSWKFKNADAKEIDGALVEIMPKRRTPVQYLETDHVFQENFQKGKFLIFRITSEGIEAYKYDSAVEEVSFSLEVNKGEIVCMYALEENDGPGEIVECEQPGFISAKLTTVADNATQIGDLTIPDEFWKAIKMLDEGREEGLPVDILDMSDPV